MTDTAVDLKHNEPEGLTPEEALRANLAERHETLVRRAEELLDAFQRAPDAVEDVDTAHRVADFIKQLKAAVKNGNAARVDEKEPHLNAGRIVDGFFKTKITDPLDKAAKALGDRLTAYQRKVAAEERARREEAERRQREEAERLEREAAEKVEALASDEDLDDAVAAEEQAKAAAAAAAKADAEAHAKAADLSRERTDLGTVSSLRAVWVHDERSLDRKTLDLEALRGHIPEDALHKAVRSFIRAGGRELTGVRIYEDERTVVR